MAKKERAPTPKQADRYPRRAVHRSGISVPCIKSHGSVVWWLHAELIKCSSPSSTRLRRSWFPRTRKNGVVAIPKNVYLLNELMDHISLGAGERTECSWTRQFVHGYYCVVRDSLDAAFAANSRFVRWDTVQLVPDADAFDGTGPTSFLPACVRRLAFTASARPGRTQTPDTGQRLRPSGLWRFR